MPTYRFWIGDKEPDVSFVDLDQTAAQVTALARLSAAYAADPSCADLPFTLKGESEGVILDGIVGETLRRKSRLPRRA